MSDPSRSLSIGDACPDCGRAITETLAGGLLAYCWWCNDRAEKIQNVNPRRCIGGGF